MYAFSCIELFCVGTCICIYDYIYNMYSKYITHTINVFQHFTHVSTDLGFLVISSPTFRSGYACASIVAGPNVLINWVNLLITDFNVWLYQIIFLVAISVALGVCFKFEYSSIVYLYFNLRTLCRYNINLQVYNMHIRIF